MEDETYAISLEHVNDCPQKDEALVKIEENWKWCCFIREIESNKKRLVELLCQYFNSRIENIVIFGTGFLGQKCYENLSREKIIIQYFSDNNVLRWNREIHGVRVVKPMVLKNIEGYVLIAVKECGNEIKTQLNNMKNINLKCVTIKELETYYYEQII